MAAWILPAAMMAMSLLKSRQEQEQRKEDLLLEAEKTRGAYYTRNTGQRVARAQSPWTAMAGGALAGYQTGSNIERAGTQNELMKEMIRTEQLKQMMGGGGDSGGWRGIDMPVIPYNQELYSAVS